MESSISTQSCHSYHTSLHKYFYQLFFSFSFITDIVRVHEIIVLYTKEQYGIMISYTRILKKNVREKCLHIKPKSWQGVME